MDQPLKGRIAVVTGGSGVLGSHIAAGLAARGAGVAILGRSAGRAEAAASEIRASGGKAAAFAADVMERPALEEVRTAVVREFGTVDILVNAAGGNRSDATTSPERPFFDLPVDALREVSDLNFLGSVLPSQVFGGLMAEKGSGCIVNISSMAAFTPLTKTVAYSGGKAAVTNFTRWLAVHMNREYSAGIRVNAVAPGFFSTHQNRYLLFEEGADELTPRGRSIIDHTPMGRFGAPGDLVGPVVFLCSDEASFITGAVIPVDGGFSAYSGV